MYTEEELKDKRPKELLEIILEMQLMVTSLQTNQLSEDLMTEVLKIVLDESIRPLRKAKRILEIVGYG